MALSLRPAWAVVVGVTFAAPLAAQRNVPATYAITNARIVPVGSPTIPSGTVVIRNGLIAAVGASVTAPADARIIDGNGLTVYPGFIDAYGTLGLPTAAGNAAGGAAGRTAAATTTARPAGAPNSTNVVGLQPEVTVVDALDPDESSFTAAHAAGFTSAFTATGTGVFRGSAAMINLDGTDVSALILKDGVAQSVGFSRGGGGFGGGGGGGFPGSLFAVFAALRQELLDAQRYRDLKLAYDKNPRGMQRPAHDASLEALQPVLARQQQVVMFANTEREIIRALDLAKEFNLRVVLAGGTEAYKLADRLKAENVPVLLSVNFPRRTAAGGGATGGGAAGGFGGGRGGAPADDEPELMRTLRERVEAPKSAGRLSAAGVRIAFQSSANFTEYLANVRRAVEGGLAADQALRAMTLGPAELFGVSDRVGTIEAGKIANLTITRGDLLDKSSRVTQLFIDGKQITIPAPTAGAQNSRTP